MFARVICLVTSVLALLAFAGAASAHTVTPNGHSYGDVPIGRSVTQEFTLTASDLAHVQGIDLPDGSAFHLAEDNCTGLDLFGSDTCTFAITFTPTASGLFEATVQILVGDSTIEVLLNGEGVAEPVIDVSPSAHDFGPVAIGDSSSVTFVVSNTGVPGTGLEIDSVTLEDEGNFTITENTCDATLLDSQETCEIDVVFTPHVTGLTRTNLVIASNDGWSPTTTVQIEGFGVPPEPQLRVVPSSHDFGDIDVGQAGSQVFTITNEGDPGTVLEIGQVGLDGPDAAEFEIIADTCSDRDVPKGDSCAVTVEFRPSSAGDKTAMLVLPSNDPDSSSTEVGLTGTGVVPSASVAPASHDFGEVTVGQTSILPVTFTVTKDGGPGSVLEVGLVAITGADASHFTIVVDNCSNEGLEQDEKCTVEVVFSPSSVGAKSATLVINTNAPGAPATASLIGTGLPAAVPELVIDPDGHDFGDVKLGEVDAQAFTVTNDGEEGSLLVIGQVAITGVDASEFELLADHCSGRELEEEEVCLVTVEFRPSTAGSKSATLVIDSNDPSSPATANLTGTGFDVPIPGAAIDPAAADLGQVQVG